MSLRSSRTPRPPAPREVDDAELVARAIGRDRAAEETIYRRHVGYVSGLVFRLLPHPSEAEDVVQDTFCLAFEQLHRLRVGTALRPWLSQIAVSQVHRRFRRRRLRRLLGLEGADDGPALERLASNDATPEQRAELAALGRMMAALLPSARIAWMLRYVEGATIDEVAAACRCSTATAKRRIAAAAGRVREVVALEELGSVIPVREEGKKGADAS